MSGAEGKREEGLSVSVQLAAGPPNGRLNTFGGNLHSDLLGSSLSRQMSQTVGLIPEEFTLNHIVRMCKARDIFFPNSINIFF